MCQLSSKINRPNEPIAIPAAADDKQGDDTIRSDLSTSADEDEAFSDLQETPKIQTPHRRVRFQCDHDNIAIHQTEPMSEEEFHSYYMQLGDFERCDMDIKETIMHWFRNQTGRAVFDTERFTIRGLEDMLDHMKHMDCVKKSRAGVKAQHCHAVLQEMRRQKEGAASASSSSSLDAEQIREVSEGFSTVALERAIQSAERDADFVRVTYAKPLSEAREKAATSKTADVSAWLVQLDDDDTHHHNGRSPFFRRSLRLPAPVKVIGQECAPTKRTKKTRGFLSFWKRSTRNPCA